MSLLRWLRRYSSVDVERDASRTNQASPPNQRTNPSATSVPDPASAAPVANSSPAAMAARRRESRVTVGSVGVRRSASNPGDVRIDEVSIRSKLPE